MSKIDHALFSAHNHALADAFGHCPECDGQLTIRRSKAGPFIGCANYPECHYTKPLHDTETQIIKPIDGSDCPECGHELAIKKGRYGMFIGCSNIPDCHYISSLSQKTKTQVPCPNCESGALLERTNRFGKIFYSCNQFPHCKYAVNQKPVHESCDACGWTILVEGKSQLECPQPHCGHTKSTKK